MNPESQPGESAKGEFRLADELCKVISKAQWLYIKQRFGKSIQKINPLPEKQSNKQKGKTKRNRDFNEWNPVEVPKFFFSSSSAIAA